MPDQTDRILSTWEVNGNKWISGSVLFSLRADELDVLVDRYSLPRPVWPPHAAGMALIDSTVRR